jgi:hypothetical protein
VMIKRYVCVCILRSTFFRKRKKHPFRYAFLYANPAPNGRIFVKFCVENFHENLSHNYNVGIKWDSIWDTSLGDVSSFYIVDSDVNSSK